MNTINSTPIRHPAALPCCLFRLIKGRDSCRSGEYNNQLNFLNSRGLFNLVSLRSGLLLESVLSLHIVLYERWCQNALRTIFFQFENVEQRKRRLLGLSKHKNASHLQRIIRLISRGIEPTKTTTIIKITVIIIIHHQDYVHPDDQTQPTFEMTSGFKPFTVLSP